MTPSARIQATLELLQEIDDTPRPADALVSAYFRARRFIGSHDRAEISTRLYAVLRHQARLDWWVGQYTKLPLPLREGVGGGGERLGAMFVIPNACSCGLPPSPGPFPQGEGESSSPRLRLLAWLALGEKLKLKNIGELCSGGKYAPEALEESERVFLRKLEGGTIEHPDMPEEIIAECPPDCFAALKKKFGKSFMREMRAMQEPATLDLRINPLKTTREEILAALQQLRLKAESCALSPWGVRVFERPSLNTLPMLKNGLVEIQDEGSQMVAVAVDAQPGERIVDFCAGAGGKTLTIAACMQNKGKIIACDVRKGRLKRSTERFRRAGLHNIETRILSSERDPWVKKHKASFDRVLADAPCSGTGTWRRNPDARWRPLGPGLEKLLKTQAEILDSAARLVKAGGRLIYATCSLLPDENESQIENFLAAHPDFTLLPCGLNGADYLSLSPAQHHTDGFFAAVMARAAKAKE
ncbi:MAG: RsmB/NOP family class I SAM-dependent RNA methyltransferase [Alphaproteobacteria bacterium]|nr:RsmB/NOP family class I SAM-dependent RNA methyltransferase [Alphaproteobacteria bacterium]